MKRYLYILIAACVAVGCTKDDTSLGGGASTLDPNAVNFSGSSDNWVTKGSIYDEETNPITEMEVFAYYTADIAWGSTSLVSSDILRFMTNQKVTKSGNTWSYTPLRYWPTAEGVNENEGDNNKITFFAFAPYGEITASGDEGCHTFSYVMSSLAQENEDLVAAATLDSTIDDGGVVLSFDHTLTKIAFQTQLKGECEEDESYEDVSYTVYGVSLHGVYNNSALSINTSDGSFTWSTQAEDDNITNTSTVELVATHGYTLSSEQYNLTDYTYDSESDENNYFNVLADGQAIFVLPQYLSSYRGTAPTVSVRILKSYTDQDVYTEVIYETKEVEIPVTSGCKGWEAGQSIIYSLTLDIGNLSEIYIPMALTSEIYTWSEVDVDVDVHSNLYIYSSLSKIAMQTDDDGNDYGEFMICTNYDYNMRVPHHRVELDGEITSSRGFIFCTDDFTGTDTYHVGNIEISGYEDYKIFVPTLLSIDDEAVTKRIVYATESDLESLSGNTIYRYTSGYNDEASREVIFTDKDVVIGQNGYAYVLDGDYYRLLYLDPKQESALTAFNYTTDLDPYATDHEIQLSNFANDEGAVLFKIEISADYSFDFSVTRSTRTLEGLYVSTAIDDNGSDNSYGVNKEGDDAVYVLRLSVDTSHLTEENDYSFNDIIGAELISNGGGMITQYFPVTLYTTDSTLAY